jgi:hypothetical protein
MSENDRARMLQLADDLTQELAAFDSIVAEARTCLDDLSAREPSYLELRGAGDIAHDYYNAIEHFFERVAVELNGGLPAGRDWHATLLARMARELPGVRPAVISSETRTRLDELLRFRHLFRHRYGFDLVWPKVRPLLETIRANSERLRGELSTFIRALTDLAAALGGEDAE